MITSFLLQQQSFTPSIGDKGFYKEVICLRPCFFSRPFFCPPISSIFYWIEVNWYFEDVGSMKWYLLRDLIDYSTIFVNMIYIWVPLVDDELIWGQTNYFNKYFCIICNTWVKVKKRKKKIFSRYYLIYSHCFSFLF